MKPTLKDQLKVEFRLASRMLVRGDLREWAAADVKQGEAGSGPLVYFPNYSTGFEDFEIWNPSTWGTLAALSAYQVTMLADLSHWNITSNQAAFSAMF